MPTIDITIRKPFQPVERVSTTFDPKEGRTKQSFRDDCDINKIIKKYQKSGFVPPVNENGLYSDTSSADLFTAMIQVAEAKSMFEELPAHVRSKFEHNPVKFLEYAENPANQEGLIELGLAKRIPQPDPVPTEPAKPALDPQKEIITKKENPT